MTEPEELCEHPEYIRFQGDLVCAECGEIQQELCYEKEWRYYGSSDMKYSSDPSRCTETRTDTRNIMKDVERMQYPMSIVTQANRYYQLITLLPDGKCKTLRGDNRKALICACIFHAFKDSGHARDPFTIARDFGLTHFHRAMRDFNTWKKSHEPQENKIDLDGNLKVKIDKSQIKNYITALDLVPRILSSLNAEDRHLEGITLIYHRIEQKKMELLNKSIPKSVAAGLVYFYLRYQNIHIQRAAFKKVTGLSDVTFVRIARSISSTLEMPVKL